MSSALQRLGYPMLDMDASRSDLWSLRRYELAAWTLFVFVLGAAPLVSHRNWNAAANVRIQPLTSGPSPQTQQVGAGGSWRLDINTAGEADLELLPGIGAGARGRLYASASGGGFP